MIIRIKDCLVSSEILTECFSCDFLRCKGCCCVIGDSGAPLDEREPALLEKEFENYKKYLPVVSLQSIKEEGFSVIDGDGDLVTPLVNKHECVYSFTDENGYTFCAVEKYWTENYLNKAALHSCEAGTFYNPIGFRKPISCWLYPIRVSHLSNGLYALNLSREHLCREAFDKGAKEKVPVFKFLREPLIYRFGEDFYSSLEVASISFKARS